MSGFIPAPLEASQSAGGWNLWNRGTQFLASATVLGLGLAGRVVGNESPMAQGVSSVAIGVGLQGVIYSAAIPVIETVHKFSQSVFGMPTFFAATQVWENSTNPLVRAVSVTAIGAMLGSQVFVMTRRLVENRYLIRIRGQELLAETGHTARTFSAVFFPRAVQLIGGSIGCTGWVLVAVLIDDKVMKETASFFAVYYVFYAAGGFCESLFNRRVLALQNSGDIGRGQLQNLRFTADCVNTSALVVFIPLAFTPFRQNPHTAARIAQLPFVGAVAGLFEGFVGATYRRKLTEIPVNQIPELRKPSLENHQTYRNWRGAWTVTVITGMTGFCAWQVGWDLADRYQREAISTLFVSFASTLPFCYWADTWNEEDNLQAPTTRQAKLEDWAISYLVDPRILEIPPAYFFFVLTNALELNDVALSEQSPLHRGLTDLAWASYGHAMGLEVYTGLTSRQLAWINRLFMINAVLSWRRQLEGHLS